MLKKKQVREKGKIKLSCYFQKLKKGDRVSVVREVSLKAGFPRTLQGRTGVVDEQRGKCYVVRFNIGKGRRFIIHPIHLKKLNV